MTKKTIAHFTDTHLGQKPAMNGEIAGDKMRYVERPGEHVSRLQLVLEDIWRRGIADVVFGGDIGTKGSVGRFFELLNEYEFTSSIGLGNHDAYADIEPYCRVGIGPLEGKMCSAVDDGQLKRIILDSSDNTIGPHQLAWLARELDGARDIALFLHHPILEIDTPVDRSGAALGDRHEIKTLLMGAKCNVWVFCGHYHMADDKREANIQQFVTPAVSYQIVQKSDRLRVDTRAFGYRIVDVDGPTIRTEVVSLSE